MENKTYFNEIKTRFIKAAMRTNDNAVEKDVNRNHVNYGCCTAWAQVMRDMGHETDVPVWEDNGYLKIPFVEINGKKVEFNNGK
jgi:hypothetical protein